MSCDIYDVAIDIPDGPTGPTIPGFGVPFALNTKPIKFPGNMPEDLMDLFNKLSFLIPPGALQAPLSFNTGKDVFDTIMKFMDQFMPFLMLYKFFLPVLNMIVCVIEVLCAIPNPFKVVAALNKLFRKCLPEFLNLFPFLAIVIMIISLLLLLLALVEYIINKVLELIEAIARNIRILNKAIQEANANSIISAAQKIGALLCEFQNLFVLLSMFSAIIKVVKDILSTAMFSKPCDDQDPSGCCSSDVCPTIVRSNTTGSGQMQYYNALGAKLTVPPGFPAEAAGLFNVAIRKESWQLFDFAQIAPKRFYDVLDAADIEISFNKNNVPAPKPVFFPTEVNYDQNTPSLYAAYNVDLRLFYNPPDWNGRKGTPRFIRINDCVVTGFSRYKKDVHNNPILIPNGVITLEGGLAYEDYDDNDPDKVLKPIYEYDVILNQESSSGTQATLNTFLHINDSVEVVPSYDHPNDGLYLTDVQYTFKPNIPMLVGKGLIVAGCSQDVAASKSFVNTMFDESFKLDGLKDMLNNFPDTDKAMECMYAAMATLRQQITYEGLATFQMTTSVCLDKLKSDAETSLLDAIKIGFDPCNSEFTLDKNVQFVTKPIKVKVDIRDSNKVSLTRGISDLIASKVAIDIKGYPTFGDISGFSYDGYQYFTADLTSTEAGKGKMMVSFDNQIFCNNIFPDDLNELPKHILQEVDYEFIYAPYYSGVSGDKFGTGDLSDGQPRRDATDVANDSKDI